MVLEKFFFPLLKQIDINTANQLLTYIIIITTNITNTNNIIQLISTNNTTTTNVITTLKTPISLTIDGNQKKKIPTNYN